MPVKIGKGAKIGNQNAIGDNASVNVTKSKENNNKMWFVKHPWLSAIICSIIAGIILLINWTNVLDYLKGLFSE
jgi:hypothetical protein